MWEDARRRVNELFFRDEIELYRNDISIDSIGEEHEEEILVGTYACNIQNDAASITSNVSGKSISQTLRISLVKGVMLEDTYTYKIRITRARLQFNDKFLKVVGFQEGQISTVLTVAREVLV